VTIAARLAALPFVIAIACGGAGHPTRTPAEVGRAFTLGPGDAATLSAARLTVVLERVHDDSRCPLDVMCAWAGDAVARVRLTRDGAGERIHELHLNRSQGPGEVAEGAFAIDFVNLAPSNRAGQPIAPEDYRATFVVRRRR
jgi:hypothetical protein